ncbi:putative aminoglycoside phosphotransferase [Halalkaliarchaeum sp. AArc-CO]|uniref:fructosamine kinase family protein n=1 Tax=Halalkaliarchaeum sp. AArc-CO TaxID=2866381 RepID=UPI00217D3537|nr:fructosamine kinase family protein [Halalkaliarchaeum sp. AArc-CO]UWG50418.1 putative aminoglycoside phosphotransferase [Halalkaliarchaeum sp. AArc-CO]
MEETTRTRIREVVDGEIDAVRELDGGMIGVVERVDLADGRTLVAKTGETPLSVEGRMLSYLRDRGLPVPTVHHANDELLLMDFIEGCSRLSPAIERDAAERLAALHDHGARGFGFPFDTLTGPVEQPNPWTDDWARFYIRHRVGHVLELSREAGTIDDALANRVEAAVDVAAAAIDRPVDPGLIHGDVWRTNLLASDGQLVAFLDPACYYADPEIELAYADWTGTFGEAFFDRYDEVRGIDPGFFERRRFVYRLYPLLVHVHLFGASYQSELGETLQRIHGMDDRT